MAVLCIYIVLYMVYGKLIVQIYFLEGALWVVRYQGTITTGTVIKAQLIILIYVSQVWLTFRPNMMQLHVNNKMSVWYKLSKEYTAIGWAVTVRWCSHHDLGGKEVSMWCNMPGNHSENRNRTMCICHPTTNLACSGWENAAVVSCSYFWLKGLHINRNHSALLL